MNAKDHILKYITDNPSCLTSDILIYFNLPVEYVIEVLDRLEVEGLIEGRYIKK